MKDVGSPLYKVVLLFLSVYVLSALIAEAFLFENAETRRVLQYIDFGVCLLFLIDFFVGLWKAPQKHSYMKWGWIDLISSIPAVDPLRWGRLSKMVRIVRYLRAIKSLRILLAHLHANKFETLSLCVFFAGIYCLQYVCCNDSRIRASNRFNHINSGTSFVVGLFKLAQRQNID